MSSTSDKLSGKAKQVIGGATDNDKLRAEGNAQETKGNLKDKIKDIGEKVADKIDDVAHKTDKK